MSERNRHVLAVGEELPPMETGSLRKKNGSKPKINGSPMKGERFQTINAFVDITLRTLTLSERSVWLILWRDTKPNGLAKTSQASIAQRAGITDRAVRKALTSLAKKELVIIARRGNLRDGPSVYRVRALSA